MHLAPYIDQSIFHYILLGKISHVYEIDSSHIIAESEQIDGQSDIRTIAGIVDDPKYFRFADSTFSGRSVQFRHFIRLERVVFRLGTFPSIATLYTTATCENVGLSYSRKIPVHATTIHNASAMPYQYRRNRVKWPLNFSNE